MCERKPTLSPIPPEPQPDWSAPVRLGRTGLLVGRLGVSAGYGIDEEGMELALSRGQNLFYWGSLRRRRFGRALARMARADRSAIAIALQSYSRSASLLRLSVERALRSLGTDFADLLILGYWGAPPPPRILDAARRLRERGLVRFLCVSCHNQDVFAELLRVPDLGVLMARYNPGHLGAREKLFPLLGADRPGVLAFTSTHWGRLLDPRHAPPGEPVPRPSDCYRFALSHPGVDAVLCGPKDAAQMREALAALERGPMSEEELAWMIRVGERAARGPGAAVYQKF